MLGEYVEITGSAAAMAQAFDGDRRNLDPNLPAQQVPPAAKARWRSRTHCAASAATRDANDVPPPSRATSV